MEPYNLTPLLYVRSLLRGVGERGSRVWNRLHHTLGMARVGGGAAKYDMTGKDFCHVGIHNS